MKSCLCIYYLQGKTPSSRRLRYTYAYMLRQRGVSLEVRAEPCGQSIDTAMRYGCPKADDIARAVPLLDRPG
ncbi:MAG TPA: hypothetical protein VF355_08010 [Anaerolineaceae bacterium]